MTTVLIILAFVIGAIVGWVLDSKLNRGKVYVNADTITAYQRNRPLIHSKGNVDTEFYTERYEVTRIDEEKEES